MDYDQSTNDFCKNYRGVNAEEDIYICSKDQRIRTYYYGHGVLETYINSIGKGRNIIKKLFSEQIGDLEQFAVHVTRLDNDGVEKDYVTYNYDNLYQYINAGKYLIFDVHENDAEIYFKFNASNIELLEPLLLFSNYGANISPFSVKNLPKTTYEIPDEDKEKLNELVEGLGVLASGQFSRKFLSSICNKKYTKENLKSDMRHSCLKGNAYIHYAGLWDRYLRFIRKELDH